MVSTRSASYSPVAGEGSDDETADVDDSDEPPWRPTRLQRSSRMAGDFKAATWNVNGLSQLRLDVVDALGYDCVLLAETKGAHREFESARYVCCGDVPASDRGAGAGIRLSQRAADAVLARGHRGHRLVWVRLEGVLHNIFVLGGYVPYAGKSTPPFQAEILDEVDDMLRTLPAPGDMVILLGDFNSRLGRSMEGVSGRFCVHPSPDAGGKRLAEIARYHRLFASSTQFQPKGRKVYRDPKGVLHRGLGNATYIMDKSGESGQAPAQLDYILVSRRWASSVRRCYVRWGPSMLKHKAGQKHDHGMVVAVIRQRVRTPKDRPLRHDFKRLVEEPAIQQEVEEVLRMAALAEGTLEAAVESAASTEHAYEQLNAAMQEALKAVPMQAKKRGKVQHRSPKTMALLEERKEAMQGMVKGSPEWRLTVSKYRNAIVHACRSDYRKLIASITELIREADEKGNASDVSKGVATLLRLGKSGACKQPAVDKNGKAFKSPGALADAWGGVC